MDNNDKLANSVPSLLYLVEFIRLKRYELMRSRRADKKNSSDLVHSVKLIFIRFHSAVLKLRSFQYIMEQRAFTWSNYFAKLYINLSTVVIHTTGNLPYKLSININQQKTRVSAFNIWR